MVDETAASASAFVRFRSAIVHRRRGAPVLRPRGSERRHRQVARRHRIRRDRRDVGSGKSSLFRAGVLPSLLGGYAVTLGSRWLIADCRPGSDPIGDVARKLGPLLGQPADQAWLRKGSSSIVDAVRDARARGAIEATDNILILIDQFEELFRYPIHDSTSADRDEKAEFVAMLLRSIQHRRIASSSLTMRSDFLGTAQVSRPARVDQREPIPVPRLTRQQRRAAIEGRSRPAAAITGRSLSAC